MEFLGEARKRCMLLMMPLLYVATFNRCVHCGRLACAKRAIICIRSAIFGVARVERKIDRDLARAKEDAVYEALQRRFVRVATSIRSGRGSD